jgi:hypothetical protein
MILSRSFTTAAAGQACRRARRLRARLATRWAAVLLAASFPLAAHAAWECEFLPDATSFKPSDVVTGRVRVRYLARGRGAVPGPVMTSCSEARFYITGPDGITIGMSDAGDRQHRQDWCGCPFRLKDGQEAWLPVCLARWEGRDVFAAAGGYRIVVSLTLRDSRTCKAAITTAPPVAIQVAAAGVIPSTYRDLLDRLPTICGASLYNFRLSPAQLDSIDFGSYTEPALALLNYQFWQVPASLWLHQPKDYITRILDDGLALCRRRLGNGDYRGRWFIDRLRELERAGIGQWQHTNEVGYPDLGAGDPIIDCPEGL